MRASGHIAFAIATHTVVALRRVNSTGLHGVARTFPVAPRNAACDAHRMSEPPIDILYAGPGLAGRTTSIAHVLGRTEPRILHVRYDTLTAPVQVRVQSAGGLVPLRIMRESFNHLHPGRLCDAILQPIGPPSPVLTRDGYDPAAHRNAMIPLWRSLSEFLQSVRGVVFVVDSQVEREEANVEHVANVARNFEDLGRDLAKIAVVFQFFSAGLFVTHLAAKT